MLASLHRASLGLKLVVFSVIVSTALVTVAFMALSVGLRDHTRNLLAQTLEQHQKMLAGLQRRSLADVLRASAMMSENPTLQAAMEIHRIETEQGGFPREDLLATIRIEAEKIAAGLGRDLLIVTGTDARVLAAIGNARDLPSTGTDLSGRPVIDHALSQDTPVGAGNFSVLKIGDGHYQVGSVPIVLQGFIIGTLTLGDAIDQGYAERLADSFDSRIAILAGDTVLGSTLEGPVEPSPGAAGGSLVTLGEEEFVAASSTIGLDDAGRPVVVHLLSSLTDAMSASSRSLMLMLLGYGSIVVIATGASAWAVSRSVLRPLEDLVDFMRTSTDGGDRSRRFHAPDAGSEVRVLARTFNELMESLQEHERRLLRKAEEDLARLEMLKESEKLASLGRMLAGAAHEINNPMTGVIGNVELLLQDGRIDEGVRRRLAEVRKQGHRIVALTRSLLKVARRDDGRRERVEVGDILRDTVALRRRDFERAGIALELDLPPVAISLMANELELQQVFLNIVGNGLDALAESGIPGGRLTIEVVDSPEGPTITFIDNGPGMSDPSQVFEHFYTTKPPGKGTGLGLGICRGIIESHGGRITAENRPPGGACFTIVLPRQERTPLEVFPAASPGVPASRQPLPASILIVDDEPVVLDLQMAILDSLGARVVGVSSGADAIARLCREDFDLIVSDLMIAGEVSGQALYDWASRNRRSGASGFVFVTGDPSAEGLPREDGEGPRFLRKPFEMDEYVQLLRETLNET